MESNSNWYLMKSADGTVFGPVPMSQLVEWAASAQISPLDKISQDQIEWNRAPTCPALKMDWLVQSSPGQLYGPTTIGALAEFILAGEINAESMAINCVEARQCTIKDIPELAEALQAVAEQDEGPGRASVRETLQQRVRDLEEMLLREHALRVDAESKLAKLAARYKAATGNEP